MPLVACQATYSLMVGSPILPPRKERALLWDLLVQAWLDAMPLLDWASVRLFEGSPGGLSHRPYSAELFDSLATLAQFSETGRLFCGTYDERTCQFMGTHFPLLWISQNADRS